MFDHEESHASLVAKINQMKKTLESYQEKEEEFQACKTHMAEVRRMVHDLNNLMTRIIGHANLASDVADNVNLQEALTNIIMDASKSSQLIQLIPAPLSKSPEPQKVGAIAEVGAVR